MSVRRRAGAAALCLVLATAFGGLPVVLATTGGAASAAPSTCRGLPATIVGGDRRGRLVGTEGDDVIVTDGASSVRALGGDDVICTTGFGGTLYLEAGPGDDIVDRRGDLVVTASSPINEGVKVSLGPGVDLFEGLDTPEEVDAGGGDTVHGNGAGRDRSSYGDDVSLGAPGEGPATATVRLSGNRVYNEVTFLAEPAPGLDLEVADGGTLDFQRALTAESSWHVDLRHHALRRDGVDLGRVDGFDSVWVGVRPGSSAVRVTGSGIDDDLLLLGGGPVVARMGGGDDQVRFEDDGCTTDRTLRARGGRGDDTLQLSSYACEATRPPAIDLGAHRVTLGTSTLASFRGFRDAFMDTDSPSASLRGNRRSNVLTHEGCGGTLRGGNSADRLVSTPPPYVGMSLRTYATCRPTRSLRLFGGPGDDVLRRAGGANPAVLVGGPGRDVAEAPNPEKTECRAEVARGC